MMTFDEELAYSNCNYILVQSKNYFAKDYAVTL